MHVNNKIRPIQPSAPSQVAPSKPGIEGNFQQVMDVEFSKHANLRLDARDIRLDGDQMKRLEHGVARAQNKGIRDSLVLIDNIALVVNIKNKVVITALNRQEQVITNIDGAVIV
jgi:flagellar operon protein